MKTITLELPDELLDAAGLSSDNAQLHSLKLIVLELFRENAISLGKAAELCNVSIDEFMNFAASRRVPLHYTEQDLEEDRTQLRRIFL
ncbi:MAG: UPF0175 family protein [Bacteroidetes bacterium]|nr:MAG: UPF0175 family protein [Bacteroidota bacterium]